MGILLLNIIGAIVLIVIDRDQPAKGAAEYQELSAAAHMGAVSVDFELLSEQNPDIRAWLISEGTGIDYPIVQGEDNEYYRKHLFSGKADSLGCLYIDAAQSDDLSEKNTVIYGGAQLDSLYRYAQQDYYELLPSMTILTPEGRRTLILYAGIRTSDITGVIRKDFSGDAEFASYVSWLKEHSVFQSNISISEGDRLLTLCADNGEEGFVLVGKLV